MMRTWRNIRQHTWIHLDKSNEETMTQQGPFIQEGRGTQMRTIKGRIDNETYSRWQNKGATKKAGIQKQDVKHRKIQGVKTIKTKEGTKTDADNHGSRTKRLLKQTPAVEPRLQLWRLIATVQLAWDIWCPQHTALCVPLWNLQFQNSVSPPVVVQTGWHLTAWTTTAAPKPA